MCLLLYWIFSIEDGYVRNKCSLGDLIVKLYVYLRLGLVSQCVYRYFVVACVC